MRHDKGIERKASNNNLGNQPLNGYPPPGGMNGSMGILRTDATRASLREAHANTHVIYAIMYHAYACIRHRAHWHEVECF